jgi:hypothetical protein
MRLTGSGPPAAFVAVKMLTRLSNSDGTFNNATGSWSAPAGQWNKPSAHFLGAAT